MEVPLTVEVPIAVVVLAIILYFYAMVIFLAHLGPPPKDNLIKAFLILVLIGFTWPLWPIVLTILYHLMPEHIKSDKKTRHS